jgi:hypothetical protein
VLDFHPEDEAMILKYLKHSAVENMNPGHDCKSILENNRIKNKGRAQFQKQTELLLRCKRSDYAPTQVNFADLPLDMKKIIATQTNASLVENSSAAAESIVKKVASNLRPYHKI